MAAFNPVKRLDGLRPLLHYTAFRRLPVDPALSRFTIRRGTAYLIPDPALIHKGNAIANEKR